MERAGMGFGLNRLLSCRPADVPNERYKDLLKPPREIEVQFHASILEDVFLVKYPAGVAPQLRTTCRRCKVW
jgi:hypothetical protein